MTQGPKYIDEICESLFYNHWCFCKTEKNQLEQKSQMITFTWSHSLHTVLEDVNMSCLFTWAETDDVTVRRNQPQWNSSAL